MTCDNEQITLLDFRLQRNFIGHVYLYSVYSCIFAFCIIIVHSMIRSSTFKYVEARHYKVIKHGKSLALIVASKW